MNLAIQKTLSLLLLLVAGILLRSKLSKSDHLTSLKILILNIALPAIIFVALLKINIKTELLFLPLIAIGFNVLLYFISKKILPLYGIEKNSAGMRSLILLLPSLAPGQSCFPFLIEYLGDEALAWGALADIGNKVFVLIVAYIIAMRFYYRNNSSVTHSTNQKIKQLLLSMLNEPINIVIILSVIMLWFGLSFDNLPVFLANAISSMSSMMTPLVLIFIGVAAVFKWKQLKMLISLLLFRSGTTFLISGITLFLFPPAAPWIALVAVVFPQSAISFWPFAHISAVTALEKDKPEDERTFDQKLSLNMVALSLPFSTLVILGICSAGEFFASPIHLFFVGGLMLGIGGIQLALRFIKKEKYSFELSKASEAE